MTWKQMKRTLQTQFKVYALFFTSCFVLWISEPKLVNDKVEKKWGPFFFPKTYFYLVTVFSSLSNPVNLSFNKKGKLRSKTYTFLSLLASGEVAIWLYDESEDNSKQPASRSANSCVRVVQSSGTSKRPGRYLSFAAVYYVVRVFWRVLHSFYSARWVLWQRWNHYCLWQSHKTRLPARGEDTISLLLCFLIIRFDPFFQCVSLEILGSSKGRDQIRDCRRGRIQKGRFANERSRSWKRAKSRRAFSISYSFFFFFVTLIHKIKFFSF